MKCRFLGVAIVLTAFPGCGGGGGGGGEEAGCGDGVVQAGEACDDGASNSDEVADACRTTCVLAACGDGVVDKGEGCDDGDANSATTPDACRADCTPPICGDEVTDDGEGCDNGDTNSDDDPDACREDCVSAACGDGVMDTGEACDDGDTVDINDCTNECANSAVWTRGEPSVIPNGLAIDADANLLVAGAAGSDGWVRKYDTNGGTVWTQTYDGVDGTAVAWGVAVDSAGNVAVAGVEANVAGDDDIWVRKYDPSGVALWTRTYAGAAAGPDTARRVACDAAGNVVVVGSEALAPNPGGGWITDGWIRKYDPDGNTLWTVFYASAFGGIDYASSVAVDASGNVLATGLENAYRAAWVRKHDPDGVPIWTQRYGGVENLYAEGLGVAVDASGNVLLTGFEQTTAGVLDIWVQKYDPSGGWLWTASYDGAAHNQDRSQDIAVDSDGNVLVTGFEISGSTPDIWTTKYDPSGMALWTRTHTGNREDVGRGVRADAAGNVYVVGYQQTALSFDLWLAKYLP